MRQTYLTRLVEREFETTIPTLLVRWSRERLSVPAMCDRIRERGIPISRGAIYHWIRDSDGLWVLEFPEPGTSEATAD